MSDLITTLKEKGTNNNVYPNVKGENIPDNAISTNKLSNDSVTTQKVNDGAITPEKLSFGLYEHNIVIANNIDISIADNVVSFKILSQNPTEYTSVDDFVQLIRDRGFTSKNRYLIATGISSSDSFEFLSDVDFQAETTTNGYCDSVIIGVFVDSDLDLNVVYASLHEEDETRIYSEMPNPQYFYDNVVELF